MASGNVDLPDDLLFSKSVEEAWVGRDARTGGNSEQRISVGLLDVAKDQVVSDNSIPLSPQWLYTKPSDGKDARPLGSSGMLPDSIQKDMWRLDGSQDKKEWRKNVAESDSRRWREEERETSMLGRRERKKEGERETEYRKNDRRPENVVVRDATDSRTLTSSDRLHEVANRTSGSESRRDSKWSSRWGPEDKDKESRTEKKVDAEKEDFHVEKQSFIAGLRLLTGSDSRDKWRPRHRQDIHSGGSLVMRAAPGFGLEKDRGDSSCVGFARGRGRSNSISVLPMGRSTSAVCIGAVPLNKDEFFYPRGKLLDIYRKQKATIIDSTPDGFEELPPITETNFVTPLAFLAPDAEELVLLKDIWKGKITSSEASLHQERMARYDADKTLIRKQPGNKEPSTDSEEPHFDCKTNKDIIDPLINLVSPDDLAAEVVVNNDIFYNKPVLYGDNITNSEINFGEIEVVNSVAQSSHFDVPKDTNLEEKSTANFDISTKLPNESYPLFDAPYVDEMPRANKLTNNTFDNKLLCNPEELSLYYRDPQGDIQGPFLGVDIISWFEQGFFGIDLPVCLSDAPEGTPFQPLGEVMPHLKLELHPIPDIQGEKSELFDVTRDELESSHVDGSFASKDLLRPLSWDVVDYHVKHSDLENEAFDSSKNGRFSFPNSEALLGTTRADGHMFNDFTGQDAEVVLYQGRSLSDMEKQSGRAANDYIAVSRSSTGQHLMVSETGNTSFSKNSVSRDADLNPLGLSWSELEGSQRKLPLSSTIPGSTQSLIDNYDFGRKASPFSNQEQLNSLGDFPRAHDSWSNNFRRNNSYNLIPDNLDANNISRRDVDANQFGLEQHILLEELQKQQILQQLHQQRLLAAHQNAELAGTFSDQLHAPLHQTVNHHPMEDVEHMLKLQFEQQLHLDQLQQQHRLLQQQQQQQQQLHEHQMQLLQHHLQRHEPQPQQSQHQLHLEQLLRRQLLEPGIGASNGDPLGANMLDQILFRQQLLNESQSQSHNLSHDAAVKQLMQSNMRLNFPHHDLQDLLPHSKQRQASLEQQYLLGLQLEQLQARHLPTSRNLHGVEEERHIGGIWSVDESGQFIRTAASPNQNYSARLNDLDILQKQQGPSLLDYLSHSQRNHLSMERMQREPYEQGLLPLDRSIHMRLGTSPPNMELINALSRAQGLGAHEHLEQLHASSQIGQFASNFHSHQRQLPRDFPGVHMDVTESHWSEPARQLPAELESRLKQLEINAEMKRGVNMNLCVDNSSAWPSGMMNDENSDYGSRDYIQQEMLVRSQQPLGMVDRVPTPSHEQRDPSWLYSQPGLEYAFNSNASKMGLNGSSSEGFPLAEVGHTPNEQLLNKKLETSANFEISGRLTSRSASSSFEQKHFMSDIDLFEREKFMNSRGDTSLLSHFKDGERGKMQGLKSSSRIQSSLNMQGSGVIQAAGGGQEEFKVDIPYNNDLSKGGGLGFFSEFDGVDTEETSNNVTYSDPSKGADDIFLKHPNAISSGAPPDSATFKPAKGKSSTTHGAFDEGKQESGSSYISQASETSISNKKDGRFRRTSSSSDADSIEPSFSDMLKSTKKPMPEPETLEVGGKSARKKGKKGRQIDPSLLGFKVHSNRILMGEIQRPED